MIYFGSLFAVLLTVHLAFLVALQMRRNDLVDIVWGLGIFVATLGGLVSLWLERGGLATNLVFWIPLACLAVWSFRLSLHIGLRFLGHIHEDSRYAAMRTKWGERWLLNSYLYIFLLQGSLMIVVSMPLLLWFQADTHSLNASFALGLCVWIFGLIFESVADFQLKKFKANPANKGVLMTQGLWSWSRHPNYFGEVVTWWGLFLMTCQNGRNWIAIISPILITFLITRVSGVPLLEQLMKERKGFEEYAKRTSKFFPRPPKN